MEMFVKTEVLKRCVWMEEDKTQQGRTRNNNELENFHWPIQGKIRRIVGNHRDREYGER